MTPQPVLLKNIHTLVTMSGGRTTLDAPVQDAAILVKDCRFEWIGTSGAVPAAYADARVIDLHDHIVLPGLVNTHHHLYQTLTRALAQDCELFDWLKTLYPIWLRMDSDAIYTSALVGMAELILSGCTTTSDHLYIYPNNCQIDDEIRAASEIGIRFHATRGSMSLGESKGGLPPDRATEEEPDILKDTLRVIEKYHNPKPYSMLRIGIAPCSPFSVTTDLMRESASMARHYGVQLHTHLAETRDEELYCLARFSKRPLEYAESVNWLGPDVWYAHGVHFTAMDIERMSSTGCGVAHCPSSNMRLASGIAPIRMMLNKGMKVGLGVDGSASNDGSHVLAEARQSLLLQRIQNGASSFRVNDALWIATRGGAAVLGRDDVGQIATGFAADLIAINLNRLAYAGAMHDPVAAILLCQPQGVDFSMINGKTVVAEGKLTTLDLGNVVAHHNQRSRDLVNG